MISRKKIFESWHGERKQKLKRSLVATVEDGAYVMEKNSANAMMRETGPWRLQLPPIWKRWLENGARRDGMVRYEYGLGMAFMPELGGGRPFPQVYCYPLRERGKRYGRPQVMFTNDAVFARQKKGLFHLVVLLDWLEDVADAAQATKDAEELSKGQYVLALEATYYFHNPSPDVDEGGLGTGSHAVVRIATCEEFAITEPLCAGRP